LSGVALAALILPFGILSPAHADPPVPDAPAAPDAPGDPGSPGGPLVSAEPTIIALTVEHTPAPSTAARATRTMTVYPVPTSAAALRRITTAPNGDMWFVEQDANKVGRITPAGAITEFTLPPTTTGGGWVYDLDVDAAGNVWVVWDQGRKVSRFHPNAPTQGVAWDLGAPYGEEIRVGPDATWVTMSYDEDGILRIADNSANWHDNAPECDGALGRGRDGAMWCQEFDKLIRVNPDGSGGVSRPLPADAIYPYSVATGPNHRIWFGRDSGGTMFTSPGRGDIGWVTHADAVRTTKLGSRVAPRSLVAGRDGNVWFTSVGAAKGIGHVTKDGKRGAVAKVGNYEPTSLTYGKDGNIWFTDSENNAIVRVSRDALWVTNVDLGYGSKLKPHAQPKAKVKGTLDADRKRRKATMKLSCGSGLVPCQGKVVVKAGKRTVAKGAYAVAARATGKETVKLTAAARKLLKKRGKVAVQVTLRPASGGKVKAKTRLTR